ncbi:methyltransferase domain-containing protein [Actinoplanes sp. NPDC023936]|uniref:SAM-dependent methyltransferase n=1 Tax=Actinoplanes sp. NPDC023936 TaxID=3154910 RepID=UPI0033E3C883
MTDLDPLIRPDRYPRSSTYDPAWLVALDMGPNPLWLLEDLARDLDLRPGMRVLDLGSGKGATSVFLAREYGVDVVASDWWVGAEEATAVFEAAGVANRVTAVHAEAHQLPFDEESFDAIVSIDAFEYFGTADSYLPYLLRFLRPGGQLAVATPGMAREIRELGEIPAHIKEVVGWEAIAWHTPQWWRFQWEITGLVSVASARWQEDGWRDWLLWSRVVSRDPSSDPVVAMLEKDAGELLGFTLLTARKP